MRIRLSPRRFKRSSDQHTEVDFSIAGEGYVLRPEHGLETPQKSVPVFLAGAAFYFRLGRESPHNRAKRFFTLRRVSASRISF
jgi:hypothetical protein